MSGKFYFNLTSLAITSTGPAVHAWELCHRLMRLAKPLEVIPYTCPFRTIDNKGFNRLLNVLLRETIWDNVLAGLEASEEDYFIFTTQDVPKRFYTRKYAMVIHDIAGWHHPSVTTWGGRIFSGALPESTKQACRIFTVSDYTAQDVASQFGIPRDTIIVAPNGLSEIYKIDAPSLEEINGIKLPERYFLHVGALDPKKNLSFLLKVYERFREMAGKRNSSVKLILTGGEYSNKFVIDFFKQIQNSPYASDITILGKVKSEDLPSLYKCATAFVFPSTFEGFGLPVIESLSQGTPVLVNSNTSLTQFGNFGATVFENFDVDIWASELKKICDTAKRVDRSYVSLVKDYFDWDRTARIVAKGIGLIN